MEIAMIAHYGELRHSIVYARSGEAIVERVAVPNSPDRPIALAAPANAPRVRTIMSNDLVCASEDLEVSALTALMVRHHIGCIPVVDRLGRAVGMVTKTDLAEHLDLVLRVAPEGKYHAKDVMMPLALTLPESATITQAATLMVLEDIHHLLVVSDGGFLVGVVSSMDLVRWMVTTERASGLLVDQT
jgi:CBS domain-containing protein